MRTFPGHAKLHIHVVISLHGSTRLCYMYDVAAPLSWNYNCHASLTASIPLLSDIETSFLITTIESLSTPLYALYLVVKLFPLKDFMRL
jgi:hypothetical protein